MKRNRWIPFLAVVLTPIGLSVSGVRASVSSGISVSQSVDRFDVDFEDSLHFEIVLRWQGPQTAYLIGHPLNPMFDRFKMQGLTSSISSTGSGDAEMTSRRFRFTLVPTSSGVGTIAPVSISYLTWPDSIAGELVTEEMTVRIAEPIPVVERGRRSSLWFVLSGAALVVAAVTALVIRRTRTRAPVEVAKSAAELFLEALSEAKRQAAGDVKRFQSGLYDCLAVYLRSRYGLAADRLADDQIGEALAATDLTDGDRDKIGRWLIEARRDKFRPVTATPAAITRLESEIREVFEKF